MNKPLFAAPNRYLKFRFETTDRESEVLRDNEANDKVNKMH